jgi:hypothetical protein
VQTPAEHAQRLAGEMQALASRLRATEGEDAPVFSREDVDRLVEERLGRERKKRQRVEEELERLRQGREDAV